MLFQTLDNKQECIGIYHNGELLFGEIGMGKIESGKFTCTVGLGLTWFVLNISVLTGSL